MHYFPRTKFYFWGFNKPGVEEYGLEIEKNGIEFMEEHLLTHFQEVSMFSLIMIHCERLILDIILMEDLP